MLQTQPMVRVKNAVIPALGLGTWQLEGSDCSDIVERALRMGYRHIDTAQMYGNEEQVGLGLKNSRIERKNIFLTTKVWYESFQGDQLKASVDKSLRKLKTDYLDLLLLHWPVFEDTTMEHTLDALMQVKEEGKTRHIGISNFNTKQLEQADKHTSGQLVTNQVEYHPFLDQSPVLNTVHRLEMSLTAYSPLARGKVFQNETIKETARHKGVNEAQVVLAWLLNQRDVIAIPKTASPEHLESNLKAVEVGLTLEELERLNRLRSRDGRLIDPGFAPDWD